VFPPAYTFSVSVAASKPALIGLAKVKVSEFPIRSSIVFAPEMPGLGGAG
jgi:hypothetical protein